MDSTLWSVHIFNQSMTWLMFSICAREETVRVLDSARRALALHVRQNFSKSVPPNFNESVKLQG